MRCCMTLMAYVVNVMKLVGAQSESCNEPLLVGGAGGLLLAMPLQL